MSKKGENIKGRKSYQRPQLERVKLVLEEAVLSFCKANAGDPAGKKGAGCSVSQCQNTHGS